MDSMYNLNDNFTVGGIVGNEGGSVLVMLVAYIPYPYLSKKSINPLPLSRVLPSESYFQGALGNYHM